MGDVEQSKDLSNEEILTKKEHDIPAETKVSVETDNHKISVEPKVKKSKPRKRKKVLHTAIRNQMEFYFSDANLSKDRFMQNAIKDGPVPLETFMNFNKLRAITEDLKEIAKALKYSTVLKLSEDETKVFRVTPVRLKSQEEIDECTIYVEHLPPHATIDWITDIFSEFGKVAYVSLPKFNDGVRIKGYAFVEFCDSESAVKSVKAYLSSSGYSALEEDPGQLCSIQAFNEGANEEGKYYEKQPSPQEKDEEANSEPKPKKRKVEQDDTKTEESVETTDSNVKTDTTELTTEECHKATKKKKTAPDSFQKEIIQEAQTLPLQVMSKKEWKKLRNKYLNMQRKCFRQIRMNSRHQKPNDRTREYHQQQEIVPEEIKSAPSKDYQCGLIVKISLEEPISDAKRFKNQVKCQEGVTYVEAQDFSSVAFVRCVTAEAALSLVEKKIWNQAEIIKDQEEHDYWEKIEENRIKKRDKSSKPKKSGAERARQKKESTIDADQPGYPSRATQHKNLHIRFDDNDD